MRSLSLSAGRNKVAKCSTGFLVFPELSLRSGSPVEETMNTYGQDQYDGPSLCTEQRLPFKTDQQGGNICYGRHGNPTTVKQIGHHTKAMMGIGASQRFIFSLITKIIKRTRIRSINIRDSLINSFSHA